MFSFVNNLNTNFKEEFYESYTSVREVSFINEDGDVDAVLSNRTGDKKSNLLVKNDVAICITLCLLS